MVKAGPAGPHRAAPRTPWRGGCVGAAASLTDPCVPSLPGEPWLRVQPLLQRRPRSADRGEAAGVGSVAQVGDGYHGGRNHGERPPRGASGSRGDHGGPFS